MQCRRCPEDRVELGGVGGRDPGRVEVPQPLAEHERAAEGLLDGHLLVEREPDEQGQAVGREEAVGLVVAGERQAVGGVVMAGMVARRLGPDGRATPWYARPMSERTLISAARTLDVETGEWLAERRLLVDGDGVIEAVLGPDASAPDDARPLDLGDGWVVPGLIDCHSHLVGDLEFAGVPAVTTSAAQEAMIGVRNAARPCAPASPPCATWARTAPSSTARCATPSMPAGRPARGCSARAPT